MLCIPQVWRRHNVSLLQIGPGYPPGVGSRAAWCLAASLGETKEALRWLRRAFDLGFSSPDLLDEPDLASLRDEEEYAALVARSTRDDLVMGEA